MNFTKKLIVDLFYKLIYGCYEKESVESTFKNLKKFVKRYGGYELVELILPEKNILEKVREFSAIAEKFSEEDKIRQLLDVILELLEAPAFVDSLEFSHDAVAQRVKRSEVKAILGHWAKDNGKHGKKLNPRTRKKYSNMLELWDSNRMRRSQTASIVMNIPLFAQYDDIFISAETIKLQIDLSESFAPAGNGRNGCKYDYMNDEEKIEVKKKSDYLFLSFAEDIIAHLEPVVFTEHAMVVA